MPSVNAFWGVSDKNVWITCWSSVKSGCIVSCLLMLSISTGHDRIKVSVSRFRKGKSPPSHQISVVIESSRFQCEVGYTTNTEEWPELHSREAELS
jgi:hypothetical protein